MQATFLINVKFLQRAVYWPVLRNQMLSFQRLFLKPYYCCQQQQNAQRYYKKLLSSKNSHQADDASATSKNERIEDSNEDSHA